jgi:hypothetical protein
VCFKKEKIVTEKKKKNVFVSFYILFNVLLTFFKQGGEKIHFEKSEKKF